MWTSVRTAAITLCVVALTGCATTRVDISGSSMKEPLCGPDTEKISALVLWGPQWRPDQKEPPRREAAALRGIQDFFEDAGCVAPVDIRRLPGDRYVDVLPDDDLLRAAAAPARDRVLLIIVHELGPKLLIGIPVIVRGGTEAVIDVHVVDVHTSESLASVRTHWENGGTFVIKGVKSLPEDMTAALRATLVSSAPASH